MNNLFSIFDPSLSIFWMAWLSPFFVLLFLPKAFWLLKNSTTNTLKTIISTLKKEFFSLNTPVTAPALSQMLLTLFAFIWLNNLLSLFPYISSSSAHPIFAMTLMLPLWLGQYVYNWVFNTQSMFTHLTPKGTPPFLTPMLVLIEMVSNLIRPLTLTIRLVANISAGHLLLTLTGSLVSLDAFFVLVLSMMLLGSVALILLELAVSLIQAYVFSMLLTLFIKEVNTLNHF